MGVLDVIDTNIQKTDRNVSTQAGTEKVPNNGGVLYRDLLNMLSKVCVQYCTVIERVFVGALIFIA